MAPQSSPLKQSPGSAAASSSPPASSPFTRRGPPGPAPPIQRPANARDEEKEAEVAAAGAWNGGPLQPNTAASPATSSSVSLTQITTSNRRTNSSVLGPLQSAQGTGFEISHEIDSLRQELGELRMSNGALQQTNQELHEALAQVTERSKMLSTEHARFLDEFREKSQRSKQKLINDRQALKLNLSNTNTRLEDLEKLNNSIETDKMKVVRKLEELTNEHDALSVSYASLQKEKQIWLQKEEEYLEIQSIQTRNLEELNATVLQIQEEREGWHRKWEEVSAENMALHQTKASLESTVQQQDLQLTHVNTNLLTSQEEIMNLTQTLATHLEQIANISKQNKELHATLVNFTRTNDKDYLSELIPSSAAIDGDGPGLARIDVVHPISSPLSPDKTRSGSSDPTLHPSFTGPIPDYVHSQAFLSSKNSFATGVGNPAYNFLHTTSSLSTLHLPASFITTKLSSYILWILEHKQILENMMQRKEKLRKELEEQIVVANVEAQVHDSAQAAELAASSAAAAGGSPLRSPRLSTSRVGSPVASPSRPGTAGGNSALPPPTLLLPSLLQHTLHDLHELTHLTQHDQLQFSNFEREKITMLSMCSNHGFNKYNQKRAKMALQHWHQVFRQRMYRKELLTRIINRQYFKTMSSNFSQLRANVLLARGSSLVVAKSNEMKLKIVGAMLRKTDLQQGYAQRLWFLQWRNSSRRRAILRNRLITGIINFSENRIIKLWNRWKANVLKLRNIESIRSGQEAQDRLLNSIRLGQLDKMKKMLARQLAASGIQSERTCFISWRNWARARRLRKHQALRRIIYICCGQGLLIKCWNSWKEFQRNTQIATVSSDLQQTRQQLLDRIDKMRENFTHGYGLLRDRYRNFKIYHWWRLAYVDNQWLKRESQWRNALTSQKQLQLKYIVKFQRSQGVIALFQAWRKQTQDSKAGRYKSAQKIFRRLINIQLHAAFQQWHRFTEQDRVDQLQGKLNVSKEDLMAHKQKFIKSLVQKWRRHHLSNAFNQFYSQVQAKKARKREILDRTIRRMQHSHVWAAFRQWQSFCERRSIHDLQEKLKEQKGKFSSVLVQRWRLGTMVPAFQTWRQKVSEKKQHRRDVLDRTFRKLLNSSLWRAMRLWKRFTEQSSVGLLKQQLNKQLSEQKQWRAAELIKKWRVSALVPAFNQWKTFLFLRKRKKREILERTCRRLEHSTVWRAFRTWMSFSEKATIFAMQQQMGAVQVAAAEQRKRMAEHILQKWRTSREKARFIAWRTYTINSRAHKRQVLDRTLRHLGSGFLGKAWQMWKRYVETSRLDDMHQRLNDNKAKTAQQVIAKWRHRILTTPFVNWRNTARKQKARKREIMDRVIKRLIHSSLYRSFRIWGEYIEKTKVAFMKNKFLQQKEELNQELFEQKQKRIKALVQRWRGATLSTRFQQWRIYARTNRQKKKVRLDQIMRRMVQSSLWAGWRSWKHFVELHRASELKNRNAQEVQNTRTKHILTKTLDRMSNLLLFSGWRSWIEYTQASRAHDITKEKRKLEAQTEMLKIKQAELIRSHTQQNLLHQQQLVDKTLRRIAFSALFKAFRHWKKWSEDKSVHIMQQSMKSKELNLKLRLVAEKIAHHRKDALQPLLQRWSKYTKARRARKRELIDKTVKRLMNLMVYQSLRHWKEVTQHMAVEKMRTELESKLAYQKKQRMEHLIRTWRYRSLQPSFVGWRTYAKEMNKKKHLMKKIFARIVHIQTYNAFRQWNQWRLDQIQVEKNQGRQRVIIDRTFKRMCSSLLYRGLRTWVSYADLHKQAEIRRNLLQLRSNAIVLKLQSWNRNQAKTCFLQWKRGVRAMRKEKRMVTDYKTFNRCSKLDHVFRRITFTSLLKSFHHWRTYILRARLIVNDKLGEYSEMILQLREQAEADSLKLHEYMSENQKLKSNVLSIKHKQQTLSLMNEKQKENRAILFAYNTILARTFRAFYARVHALRRRKFLLHRAVNHVEDDASLRALHHWKNQIHKYRASLLSKALETSKKQLDQVLGKVWSLESQLAQKAAEAEAVANESQKVLLNAQAQEMNHQLEKQMPNDREIALAQEVDTLAAKLELLLKEVKERGNHIQFLSAENQRLSNIVKTTGGGISASGFSPSTADLNASAIAHNLSSSAAANQTLNLSSSFSRSKGVAAAVPHIATVTASPTGFRPSTSFAATTKGTNQFYPQ